MARQPPTQSPRPPAAHLERGRAAETLAERFLEAAGLVVVARNFRCRAGELDLVCLDADVLAVVEVRQRARNDFGGALGSVTRTKRRKIIRAAQFFLRCSKCWRGRVLRFDVIAVQGVPGTAHEMVWVRDAFRGP